MKKEWVESILYRKVASLKKEEIDCILRKISNVFPDAYYQVFYAPSPFIKEWNEEEGL